MSELVASSWLAAIAVPTLIAAALFVPNLRRLALVLAPWAPVPILLLSLSTPLGATASVPGLLLDVELEFDALARVFSLFTATTWLLAGVYIRGELEDPDDARRLHLFQLLAMSGNFGLIVAADSVSLYSSFTLMSFAGYGLVVHERDGEARRAAQVYVVFAVIGELMLFAGLVLAATVSDELTLREQAAALTESADAAVIAALLFGGAGVKAGALLLHMWLPLAHKAAPTPSSAVLSSVMIEAGLLVWLRLLPLGHVALGSLGAVVMGLGITAAFFGVLVGVVQRDVKVILAYSSISQMGLMTLAVGVALAKPGAASLAIAAATLFAVHHGLSKAALFLGVGVARRSLSRRAGLLVAAGLVLLSLAIAGAPASTGAIAKHALKQAVHAAPGGWGEHLPLLLSLSSAATLILVLRFLDRLRAEAQIHPEAPGPSRALAWGLCAGAALLSLWLLPDFGAPARAREALEASALWASAWPVLLGLALYLAATFLARRTALRLPTIPSGDLLIPLERGLVAARAAARALLDALDRRLPRAVLDALRSGARELLHRLIERERRAGWTSGALLLLALTLLFAVLLAWR